MYYGWRVTWALALTTAGIFSLRALTLVALILWRDVQGVILFVVLFGAASGASTLPRASLVADFYGPAH